MPRVMAVVGAQWGSEGKGLVVEKLAHEFDVHVRTGGPNAGHTYYVNEKIDVTPVGVEGPVLMDGHRMKIVARSVPCGAANPWATLIVGPGAFIDVDLLLEEVLLLDGIGLSVSKRLRVDQRAFVIDPIRHHKFEGGTEGWAHQAIGSTGEGIGPARMAKLARGTFGGGGIAPSWTLISQVEHYRQKFEDAGVEVCDTARELNRLYDEGRSVLLEGTQGSALSVTHGAWPYVTSHDTNAAQLTADAGLAPQLVDEVLLVARTFPIRVAGQSGPLPDETSWAGVGVPEERTTVTKKVRRVGRWHWETVARAAMLNRATSVALMFCDYVFPSIAGKTAWGELSHEFIDWLRDMENQMGAEVSMIGTGPDTVVRTEPVMTRAVGPWPTFEDAYLAATRVEQ